MEIAHQLWIGPRPPDSHPTRPPLAVNRKANVSDHEALIEDDGSPRAALDIAGQAVRSANRRTIGRPLAPGAGEGWEHPADVYRCVGELAYLTGGLNQIIKQLAAALADQHQAGHVGIWAGDPWAGNPDGAVAAAADAFHDAATHASLMGTALAVAHTALSGAEYAST